MAIILEGMDGSGKSTLASHIGLPVLRIGGPPKTKDLEREFFVRQQENAGRIRVYDRVTCITQQVYRKRMFDDWYMRPLRQLIATPKCLIVYCRPPDEILLDMGRLQAAEHDTPEMLQLVRDNAKLFVDSYDLLMSKIPHVVYDFTRTNMSDLIDEVLKTQYNQTEWKKCMNLLKETQGRSIRP